MAGSGAAHGEGTQHPLLTERRGQPSVVDGFDLDTDAATVAAIPFREAAASIRTAADLHGLLA